MAVAGAIFGAAFGGWINDKYGRKKSILLADILFFIGAIVMAAAVAPWMIILGRIFVGLGVGMASMTSPLYISESSPARIRGALVSTNGLLITGGQFLAYLINLAFTKTPGTWRWMLGVAGVPAVVQFFLMLSLPESPRWLYSQDKVKEARAILEKIYPANEVEQEMQALQSSIEADKASEVSIATVSFQNFGTVTYHFGLNAVGSIVSMAFVDRFGRRRLMIVSMFGIIVCLIALSVLFYQASTHAPAVSSFESQHFGRNSTCGSFLKAYEPSNWNCMSCLKASSDCGFCANGDSKDCTSYLTRRNGDRALDCQLGNISVEIQRHWRRDRAVSNWVSNLIVSETFLTLTEALGSSGTFLLFAGFSTIGLVAIYFLVPETKGLQFEEVEKMLEKGFKPSLCGNSKEDDSK
ncbi:hypothetical protein DH2020_033040 [Rehmannia glutinosa]|uniref:Major facilitator superfamily (MFS) profile domain-containing protein n=1 Tax=Rehmannia glutinosa TaxID=99300 RepID=A0ABR0VG60_REHGL